jgi:5'-AMP-activated protein kinase catalytic alpha subunit
MQSTIPLKIDKYLIQGKIEDGRYSFIYSAQNIQTQEKCCVKIIEKFNQNIDMICDEIAILQTLDHKNIIAFKDSFETNSHFFIFQEYFGGGSLLERVSENKKLKEHQVKKVFYQLAEVLIYLQEKGIAHRDIKLENILCNSNFEIKLIDFGFATRDSGLLETFCDSIQYCAPEILSSKPYYGMKADIWSSGIVLFKILTGYFPFDRFTHVKTINLIKKCQYSIPKSISKSASNQIQFLLVLDPEKRLKPSGLIKHEWLKSNQIGEN